MKSLITLLLLLFPILSLAASKDRFVTSTGTQLVRVTSADNVETLSNSSGAVSVGDAVYLSAANTVAKASASTTGQPVYGLVYEVVNATTCVVITRGIFPSWSTSLTPGQVYYLAETAGALQTTPVLGTSKLAQLVGTAVSSTDLWVDPVNMSAIGTSAGKILTLDYQGKLPAVDGSQLTGVGGSTSYSPTTGAHWTDPDPTTVGGGLDALAARVVSIESVTGDSELAALASVTSGENALPYFTGSGTASTTTITSTARGLLDDATAADMRTTLGLGSAATLTSGTAAGNVVTLDGSGRLPAVDGSQLTGISGGGSSPQVDIYTAADTWTMPVGAAWIEVEVQAGGGGGGSGAYYTSGTARNGGAGGGGGGRSVFRFRASDLSSPVSITVGAGGTGGASVDGGANANGNAGSGGGASSFGSYLYADGGNGGGGGTSAASAAQGGTGGGGLYAGGNGGNGGFPGTGAVAGVASALGGGGGGGGGGMTATNTAANGAVGGSSAANVMSAAGQAGGTAGNASVATGGDGDDAPAGTYYGGGGGGGGRGQPTAYLPTAPGGHGGTFGGGGGGGGAGTRYASGTVPSGAGGDGGDGFVRITTWF